MSNNIGYCKFFWQGPQQFDKSQFRLNHEPDKIECAQGNGQFKGEITSSSETENAKTIVIDGAVKVVTVTDKVRAEALKYLEDGQKNCQSIMKKFGIIDLTLLLHSAILISAGIIVGVALPAFWPVALTLAVVGLVVLGVSLVVNYRKNQAYYQACQLSTDKAQWIDPVTALQEQRQKIGALGFNYAQALRGKSVSTAELKALFKAEVQNYKRLFDLTENLSNQSKETRLKEFFDGQVWKVLSSLDNYKKTFGEDKVDPVFEPLMKEVAKVKELEKEHDQRMKAYRNESREEAEKLVALVKAKYDSWSNALNDAFESIALPGELPKRDFCLYNPDNAWADFPVKYLNDARYALTQPAYLWQLRKIREISQCSESIRDRTNSGVELYNAKRFNALQQLLKAFAESQPIPETSGVFYSAHPIYPVLVQFEWAEPYFNPKWAEVIEKKDWEDLMKKCHAKVLELNTAVG